MTTSLSVRSRAVVDEVSTQRSTWRHWNLWAEASRQTMGRRFTSADAREAAIASIVDAAKKSSVALTPPELASSPPEFRREDGTTVFRPRHATVFSSTVVMTAEDRLLAFAEDRTAPRVLAKPETDGLSDEQLRAITAVSVSGRRLDVLVGAAGAGKTTAMRALRDHWVHRHGRDSVVGLAPSAAAAHVLSEDLGVRCENTAKWLYEHEAGRAFFRRGQLVIVDEATLADTPSLDRITSAAAIAGAKVLLVGDPAQLQSVDAGGAFSMLVRARPDVTELTELHRFSHDWEKGAPPLLLRDGNPEAISIYVRNDRLTDGSTDAMLDAAYVGWKRDIAAGRDGLLVAESRAAVEPLNLRARADRLLGGETAGEEVALANGSVASLGDLVVSRRNDRTLRSRSGAWVRNGDRWIVIAAAGAGELTVRRVGQGLGTTVVLPSDYVAEHVDLGYAVTAHRAQGITVDAAHVVFSARTTRENLCVSMTRGRLSNRGYVALDEPDDSHAIEDGNVVSAATVLFGVLQRSGAELSAHQTTENEQDGWSSFAQLAAEYETIAAVAQRDRWTAMLGEVGLAENQVDRVTGSSSFGPLGSMLRRLEACGRSPLDELRDAVERRTLDDADDMAAVLHKRLTTSARRYE